MKARFFKNVRFGLALSALPFVGACNQASNSPQSLITAAQAEPSPIVASNAPAAPTAPETVSVATNPALPAPEAGKAPLPPNIKPSAPVAEVAKLAQSGVDESVMLTFVGNSTSLFGLGSDEIIYLNDLGVANNVITAMIQHDQSLKQTWAENAKAQNAIAQANAEATQAAAPTYVNPPQPEPEPVAAGAPAPAQPPVNVTYNYFYDSLSPYGTWVSVDGYGMCWQPTVVVRNSSWRPYCDGGRWMYTDAGWYWYSDYTWGWAPFHYGRWFSHPTWGWCWYPGYNWAPAWVSWRYNSSYCGWAPLPPAAVYTTGIGFTYYGGNVGVSFGFGLSSSCYSFVSWGNFCNYRPYKHCVPPAQVQPIYQNTTVINNYINGDNNVVINRGVPVDQARKYSRSEIHQVAVRETPAALGFNRRGERLDREGRTLTVSRPNFPPSGNTAAVSSRELRDTRAARLPVAGAGAASQLEVARNQMRPRASAESRERAALPAMASSRPTDGRAAGSTTLATGGETRTTAPVARPASASLGNSTRTETPGRNNNRTTTTAPLVVNGNDRAGSASTAPVTQRNSSLSPSGTQKATTGSVIVIGRRDTANTDSRANFNQNRVSPTPTSRSDSSVSSVPQSVESPGYSRPSTPTLRQTTPTSRSFTTPTPTTTSPRIQSTTPTYSASRSYGAPATTTTPARSTPLYNTPRSTPPSSVTVIRSSPTPTPSYTAPRSSPAPVESRSHSAPGSSVSSSAPRSSPSSAPSVISAPSRSSSPSPAPMRSDGGRSGSSRRN